ncbi:MAG: hypothetical protein LBD38_05435 [Streptococcaceae bacterium]|jgi:hypothetical protein|nr:hypothetical protein [Streptococcaceae bacterium]
MDFLNDLKEKVDEIVKGKPEVAKEKVTELVDGLKGAKNSLHLEKIEPLKTNAKDRVNAAKTDLTDVVEKLNDLKNKNYRTMIVIDKTGIKRSIVTDRPTKHTIKWKSKGY